MRVTYQTTQRVAVALFGLLGVGAAPASAQCLADEIQKLTASDATPSDHFGLAVHIVGDLSVVGAKNGGDLANSGAAYVFRLEAKTKMWGEQQRLTPIDAGVGDNFGISAAINPIDPNVIIVGAYLDDDDGSNSGSAYVFRYNPDSQLWVQEQKLTASDGDFQDRFGFAVSIWGDVAMVGAYLDEDPDQDTGSVYVFRYDPDTQTWQEQQKLIPPDQGRFGWSVSLHGDVALIGAVVDSEQAFQAGAAYIFRFDPKTQMWVQEQKLLASDAAQDDIFGISVSINGDVALVGAPRHDAGGVPDAGAAYLFRYNSEGAQWVQEEELIASEPSPEDGLGKSVSVNGNVAVVGAPLSDAGAFTAGAVYIYSYDPANSGWTEQARLESADLEVGDFFGGRVWLDGDRAIVGAATDDDDGSESGSAYIFGGLGDCNENGELDLCDIADGFSPDENNNGIPDECEIPPCPGDLDGSNDVGVKDLLFLVGAWGPCPPKGDCPADFDGSSNVDVKDLLILLGAWGPCP